MIFNFLFVVTEQNYKCVSDVKLTEIELIIAPKGAFDAINNIALGLHKIIKKWCDKFSIILQIILFYV